MYDISAIFICDFTDGLLHWDSEPIHRYVTDARHAPPSCSSIGCWNTLATAVCLLVSLCARSWNTFVSLYCLFLFSSSAILGLKSCIYVQPHLCTRVCDSAAQARAHCACHMYVRARNAAVPQKMAPRLQNKEKTCFGYFI